MLLSVGSPSASAKSGDLGGSRLRRGGDLRHFYGPTLTATVRWNVVGDDEERQVYGQLLRLAADQPVTKDIT